MNLRAAGISDPNHNLEVIYFYHFNIIALALIADSSDSYNIYYITTKYFDIQIFVKNPSGFAGHQMFMWAPRRLSRKPNDIC